MILSSKRITKALISLHRQVCAFVVRNPPETGFLALRIICMVFNLGNVKGGHFHLISDEDKTLPNISPFT